MRKPRILWCGEASFLNTGYSIYGREVLGRLFSTKKYEIAELSSYGKIDDDRRFDIPWTYYANMPSEEERDIYNSVVSYQFGQWRFEDVCLDFRPDIVCDIRDWWMMQHEADSAFRPYYHWMIMPAVDCHPLKEEYVEMCLNADVVFSYSEYGRDIINHSTKGLGPQVAGVCSPAASPTFSPVPNKDQHKQDMGFMDDVKIIGSVMRNQKRKLFPNLIESFAKFIQKCPEESKNTYLYLHTSYPDVGWDIPKLITESGVSNRILFTYQCKNDLCGGWFPSFYRGSAINCTHCGEKQAVIVNALTSLHEKELAKIINSFDLYVQYSICEGFGMPQVESAMCGVPVVSVDHSAMSSVIDNIGATSIPVKTLFREHATHGFRAYPDDDGLVDAFQQFFSLPKSVRYKNGRDTYDKAKERYNWDTTAAMWEEAIQSVPLRDHRETWASPPKIFTPNTERPSNWQSMSSDEFAKWGMLNLLGEPEKVNSWMHLKLARQLDSGVNVSKSGVEGSVKIDPYHPSDLNEYLYTIREIKNIWEEKRVTQQTRIPDFIRLAKREGD